TLLCLFVRQEPSPDDEPREVWEAGFVAGSRQRDAARAWLPAKPKARSGRQDSSPARASETPLEPGSLPSRRRGLGGRIRRRSAPARRRSSLAPCQAEGAVWEAGFEPTIPRVQAECSSQIEPLPVVPEEGFGPSSRGSKPRVLPLDDSRMFR